MRATVDVTELVLKLNKIIEYSEGFLIETQRLRRQFNTDIGNYVVKLLGEYIDGLARVSPESLHHVYEWGQVGTEAGRLFDFNMVATAEHITIAGTFLESQSVSPTGTVPFYDKARIMESGITVVIKPKDAEVLAFEVDGETVFTSTEVTVEHPGGEYVAGSFENAVDSFFTSYVTKQILNPLFKKMSRATEYKQFFAAGSRVGGRAGAQAARRYLNAGGIDGLV